MQSAPLEHAESAPITHTQSPIVTGASVLGIKYAGGVLVISDVLGSYGRLARFTDLRRVHQMAGGTVVAAGGEYSDWCFIKELLEQLETEDFVEDDGAALTTKEVHAYLGRVMYNRRTKVDPLWNQLIVAGSNEGKAYLGYVDLYGSTFTEDICTTGYGAHIAAPLLRQHYRPDMSEADARALLEKAMTVLFYRHCNGFNRYVLAKVTNDGESSVSEPFELETKWQFELFARPKQWDR